MEAQSKWTVEQIQFVRDNYKTMTRKDIATQINKSKGAVGRVIKKIEDGIVAEAICEINNKIHNHWTDKEVTTLRLLYDILPVDEIASRLGRETHTVYNKAKALGITKLPRWDDASIDIMKELYGHVPNIELAKMLNKNPSAIVAKAFDLGLTENLEWSEYEINFLKDNYETMSADDIAKALGRTKTAVRVKAAKSGLKKPEKYHYNSAIFHDIDNEISAYWFGFFCADGNVDYAPDDRRYAATIKLQAGDAHWLRQLNKDVDGNVEVTFGEHICSFTNKLVKDCTIRFYSKNMCEDLISHGCIPNKSLVIDFPELPEDMMWHFIRGYYDGNGSVWRGGKRTKVLRCKITTGSLKFANKLAHYLREQGINTATIPYKDKHCYDVVVGDMVSCDIFLSKMYADSTRQLDRKYLKAVYIYKEYDIASRLLRRSVTSGFCVTEEEIGNPEMGIRVEG